MKPRLPRRTGWPTVPVFWPVCWCLLWGLVLWPGSSAWAFEPYDLHHNAVLHAERGILFLERDMPEAAIDEFQSALKLNPGSALSAALYNNLGLAHRAARNDALAIAAFQHAIRTQPNYALYYKNLIETYAHTEGLLEAKNTFERIIGENPENTEVLFLLGLVYVEEGQKNKARDYFSQFLKLEPHSALADAARSYL